MSERCFYKSNISERYTVFVHRIMPYMEAIEPGKEFTRKDNMTAVIIVYRRPVRWTDRVIRWVCGDFTHCELYIPKLGGTFVTTVDCGMEFNMGLKNNYRDAKQCKNYAWHLMTLTQLEYERLWVWNMTQVSRHCKYNYSDMIWQVTPYFRSYVHDLDHGHSDQPPRLFCSQSIVLALRAAFDGNDSDLSAKAFANSMNSRLTTPGDIHDSVTKFLGVLVNENPIPVSAIDVNMYTNRMLLQHEQRLASRGVC